MFDSGDSGSVLLQAGRKACIADPERIGLEVYRRLQVNATEHDSRVRLRRTQSDPDLGAGMKPDTRGRNDGFQRALLEHELLGRRLCDCDAAGRGF